MRPSPSRPSAHSASPLRTGPACGTRRTLLGPGALEAEEDLYAVRFPRVHEYTELAGLNRITREPARPRLAILASGMAYAATLRALNDLGLSPP